MSFNKTALDRVGKRKKQVRKTTKKGNPKGAKGGMLKTLLMMKKTKKRTFQAVKRIIQTLKI